ncbi:tol-pal system-associated acyl-CoA thioesterase [Rhodobacterales bacterium HKCCE3408]|nr:tol-pal system-associated acyl-CoA thioesterase [Rhodobacterales bacterium HKCCE3408]
MTHRWPIRVYYEDTDLAGLVYYANYLKFIERARSEMVREAGIDQVAMKADGVVFAVRRVVADYLRAARYDDDLIVETELTGLTGARFSMGQTVLRGGEALFRAEVEIVCLDAGGRPLRIPGEIRRKIAGLGDVKGNTSSPMDIG